MNDICNAFVRFITTEAPRHNKDELIKAATAKFGLVKDRKVYRSDFFAVRFSYSKSPSDSFSNTVLSLSALEKYDRLPFFTVLARRDADNLILLSNTTFLKKISHSSQQLSLDNIRGSFNGSDIIRSYGTLRNCPKDFNDLFAIHQGFEWKDNLIRLVETSSDIKSVKQPFRPSDAEKTSIYKSVDRAVEFIRSDNFQELKDDLDKRCDLVRNEIIVASRIENTNIRGRLIESLITADDTERDQIIRCLMNMELSLPVYDTKNGLGDYCVEFDNGKTLTDIKTKIIYLHSNPKAYNIDKFLKQMSDQNSIFLFYFIGIDADSIFNKILCSVYHNKLIENTIFQSHWSGRSSRGTSQFNGNAINEMLREHPFANKIDEGKCKAFLDSMINLIPDKP